MTVLEEGFGELSTSILLLAVLMEVKYKVVLMRTKSATIHLISRLASSSFSDLHLNKDRQGSKLYYMSEVIRRIAK